METKRLFLKFFLLSYLVFWVLLGLTGLAISLGTPQLLQYILPIVCSWSPTFVFIAIFKRLNPGERLITFLLHQFRPRIDISAMIAVVVAQILIFTAAIYIYSAFNQVGGFSLLSLSAPSVITAFFDSLVRGPLGEEMGWRGYALNALQKRYPPLKAALVLGLIWGFWHAPLWFLTTGYVGFELVQYITYFMVSIVLLSVVITAFYNLNKNLLLPILIHQMFNFLMTLSMADMVGMMRYECAGYLLLAVVLITLNPKKVLLNRDNIPKDRFGRPRG